MANGPSRSLKAALNQANPGTLADALRAAKIGSLLAAGPSFYKGVVTSNKLTLPAGMKALAGLVAFVTAGTVTGWFAFDRDGTPATTTFSVNGQGDITFFATDAVTAAEVYYIQAQGDVIEEDVQVTSNVGAFGAGRTGIQLISVVATAGTLTGAKTPILRGGTVATGEAALSLGGSGVSFFATDAVTRATVTYIAAPTTSLAAGLAADSTLL